MSSSSFVEGLSEWVNDGEDHKDRAEEEVSEPEDHSPPQPNQVVIDENMKDNLRKFIDLSEKITEAKEALKVLTDVRTEIESQILSFMVLNNIPKFKTPIGTLKFIETKSVKPLNKALLTETISKKITDKKLAQELTDALTNRPTTSVPKIKLTGKSG